MPSKRGHKKNRDGESEKLIFIMLILCVIGGVWLLTSPSLDTSGSMSLSLHSNPQSLQPDIERSLDLHLKRVDSLSQVMELRQEHENWETAPPVGHLSLDQRLGVLNHAPGVQLSQEDVPGQILRELESEERSSAFHFMTPDERVNARLAQKEWVRQYDENYKREFAAEFIRRARLAGIEVQLNKDLEVTAIRPANDPKPLRFPQSHTAN